MPSERNTFTRPSILVRPHEAIEIQLPIGINELVEAPGTAPGSGPLITSPFIAIAG